MIFHYNSQAANRGLAVHRPSPNEGLILRALQEGTMRFHKTLARAQGAHPNMAQGRWEGWMDMEDVHDMIMGSAWCRPRNHVGMWSDSTIRAHLKRLVEKGWMEHKLMKVGNRMRVHWRIRPNRTRPLYEAHRP